MSRLARAFGWAVIGLFSSAAFQACGSSDEDSGNGTPLAGSAGAAGSSQNDGMVVDPPGNGGAGGESPFDPLCGITDQSCIPDDARSCSPGTAGAPAGAGGARAGSGSGASSGQGGSPSSNSGSGGTPAAGSNNQPGGAGGEDGGQGGMSAAGEGGYGGGAGAPAVSDGGAGGVQSDDGGGTSAGQPAAGGTPDGAPSGAGQSGTDSSSAGAGGSDDTPPTTVPRSCQVEVRDGEERSVCAPSGQGRASDACFSSADCAAGLACIGDTSPGQCRPYCCRGASACTEDGTHCTERRLVEAAGRPRVPVCMPATNCNLAEPFPCPEGVACTCPPATACVVVTAEGETSCVAASSLPGPDEGEVGDPCPCAWGYVCSADTNRCVRLCQTGAPGEACAGTRCQFADGLPPGWGVCLTTSSADAG